MTVLGLSWLRRTCLWLGACLWALSGSAWAAVVTTDNVTATLLSEYRVAHPGQRLAVILHQQIRPHWHTYWRNPGDSGQPTAITWHLPAGVIASDIQWPTPQAIRVGPLVNYAYSNAVGLISTLQLPADWPAGKPLSVVADAKWLVCEEECVPESGHFELSIPTQASGGGDATLDPVAQPLFAAARASQPQPATFAHTWTANDTEVTLQLALSPDVATRITTAHFFPDTWGVINHAAPQQLKHEGGLRIVTQKGELPTPAEFSGIVTWQESVAGQANITRAFVITSTTTSALTSNSTAPVTSPSSSAALTSEQPASDSATTSPALLVVLLSALLGGVLLNLMPCVFPVLAMKALALVAHANAPARERVIGGVAYGAGVLLSFAVLASVLLLLKASGNSIGWGFQLQSPIIVTLLAYVLFLAGLNLSGWFDVSGSFMGMGANWAAREGWLGSFFTGVLATVVATPCTAPFMATALGVAMTQPPAIALLIFITLGLGLALPYVLLSVFPAIARYLPKPGAWMDTLKQALAFPLYISAAWLLWVLAQQSGADGVFMALLGMVLLALVIWLWRLSVTRPWAQRLRVMMGLISLSLSVWLAADMRLLSSNPNAASATNDAANLWQPFERQRFDSALAAGQPVFINMTAAWCVTCKVNERVALSGAKFKAALREGGYTYFKGDWTHQNPEITQLLESFGRAGVPLYVVYPAKGAAPVVLPQMLTESLVVDALSASVGSIH